MKRITFHTAGESHGRGLVALMEGLPAGLELIMDRDVDPELRTKNETIMKLGKKLAAQQK